jgi:beta-glucosidase
MQAIIATEKPFIVVVIASRPFVLPKIVRDAAKAIIWQFSPGMLGGRACARALFGLFNPSGRLSITLPSQISPKPFFYNARSNQYGGLMEREMPPAWPFGFGLGYSEIEYVEAKVEKSAHRTHEDIHIMVTLKNLGEYDALEIIQVYVADIASSVAWATQELKGFARVPILKGETKMVDVVVKAADCTLIDKQGNRVVEYGLFEFRVGRSAADIKHKVNIALM